MVKSATRRTEVLFFKSQPGQDTSEQATKRTRERRHERTRRHTPAEDQPEPTTDTLPRALVCTTVCVVKESPRPDKVRSSGTSVEELRHPMES